MMPFVLAALLLLQPSSVAPPAQLRETIVAFSTGATSAERREAIAGRLKAAGIEFQVQDFGQAPRAGANIVVKIPGKAGSATLLVGAHYDRVPRGQGAVDNAASCAALVDLIERIKARPLANTAVTFAFFDLEEVGLVGSRAYFQALATSIPSQALNLDIFAYGDTFFVAPTKTDGPLIKAFQEAALQLGFPVRSVPMGQYPASDHRTMATAGVETLGVALLDGGEIDSILTPGPVPPRILTIIHTDNDTIDKVRDQDVAKALPVLERAIRLLDARP